MGGFDAGPGGCGGGGGGDARKSRASKNIFLAAFPLYFPFLAAGAAPEGRKEGRPPAPPAPRPVPSQTFSPIFIRLSFLNYPPAQYLFILRKRELLQPIIIITFFLILLLFPVYANANHPPPLHQSIPPFVCDRGTIFLRDRIGSDRIYLGGPVVLIRGVRQN